MRGRYVGLGVGVGGADASVPQGMARGQLGQLGQLGSESRVSGAR